MLRNALFFGTSLILGSFATSSGGFGDDIPGRTSSIVTNADVTSYSSVDSDVRSENDLFTKVPLDKIEKLSNGDYEMLVFSEVIITGPDNIERKAYFINTRDGSQALARIEDISDIDLQNIHLFLNIDSPAPPPKHNIKNPSHSSDSEPFTNPFVSSNLDPEALCPNEVNTEICHSQSAGFGVGPYPYNHAEKLSTVYVSRYSVSLEYLVSLLLAGSSVKAEALFIELINLIIEFRNDPDTKNDMSIFGTTVLDYISQSFGRSLLSLACASSFVPRDFIVTLIAMGASVNFSGLDQINPTIALVKSKRIDVLSLILNHERLFEALLEVPTYSIFTSNDNEALKSAVEEAVSFTRSKMRTEIDTMQISKFSSHTPEMEIAGSSTTPQGLEDEYSTKNEKKSSIFMKATARTIVYLRSFDLNGWNVLHHAAAAGLDQIVSLLLNLDGKLLYLKTEKDETIIHLAVMNKRPSVIEVVSEHIRFSWDDPNDVKSVSEKEFLLNYSIYTLTGQQHLASTPHPHEPSFLKLSSLIIFDIFNAKTVAGFTALHLAAFSNSIDCLPLLLMYSDFTIRDMDSGKTALTTAILKSQLNAAIYLLRFGLKLIELTALDDAGNKDTYLDYALHVSDSIHEAVLDAVKMGKTQSVKYLLCRLFKSGDLNSSTISGILAGRFLSDGKSLFQAAVGLGNPEMMSITVNSRFLALEENCDALLLEDLTLQESNLPNADAKLRTPLKESAKLIPDAEVMKASRSPSATPNFAAVAAGVSGAPQLKISIPTDIERVQIERGTDSAALRNTYKITDKFGRSPLQRSVEEGKCSLIFELLSTSECLLKEGKDRSLPIFTAVKLGGRCLQELIEYQRMPSDNDKYAGHCNLDFNAWDSVGRTVLHLAASLGDFTTLSLLLESGLVDRTMHDLIDFDTFLHTVAEKANYKQFKQIAALINAEELTDLFQKGNNDADTPLMQAVRVGNTDAVRAILEFDGGIRSLTLADKWTRLPLYVAVDSRYISIVEMLVKNGADVSILADTRQTPLTLALDLELWEVAQLMTCQASFANHVPLSAIKLDKSNTNALLKLVSADECDALTDCQDVDDTCPKAEETRSIGTTGGESNNFSNSLNNAQLNKIRRIIVSRAIKLEAKQIHISSVCAVADDEGRSLMWWSIRNHQSQNIRDFQTLYELTYAYKFSSSFACDTHRADIHGISPFSAALDNSIFGSSSDDNDDGGGASDADDKSLFDLVYASAADEIQKDDSTDVQVAGAAAIFDKAKSRNGVPKSLLFSLSLISPLTNRNSLESAMANLFSAADVIEKFFMLIELYQPHIIADNDSFDIASKPFTGSEEEQTRKLRGESLPVEVKLERKDSCFAIDSLAFHVPSSLEDPKTASTSTEDSPKKSESSPPSSLSSMNEKHPVSSHQFSAVALDSLEPDEAILENEGDSMAVNFGIDGMPLLINFRKHLPSCIGINEVLRSILSENPDKPPQRSLTYVNLDEDIRSSYKNSMATTGVKAKKEKYRKSAAVTGCIAIAEGAEDAALILIKNLGQLLSADSVTDIDVAIAAFHHLQQTLFCASMYRSAKVLQAIVNLPHTSPWVVNSVLASVDLHKRGISDAFTFVLQNLSEEFYWPSHPLLFFDSEANNANDLKKMHGTALAHAALLYQTSLVNMLVAKDKAKALQRKEWINPETLPLHKRFLQFWENLFFHDQHDRRLMRCKSKIMEDALMRIGFEHAPRKNDFSKSSVSREIYPTAAEQLEQLSTADLFKRRKNILISMFLSDASQAEARFVQFNSTVIIISIIFSLIWAVAIYKMITNSSWPHIDMFNLLPNPSHNWKIALKNLIKIICGDSTTTFHLDMTKSEKILSYSASFIRSAALVVVMAILLATKRFDHLKLLLIICGAAIVCRFCSTILLSKKASTEVGKSFLRAGTNPEQYFPKDAGELEMIDYAMLENSSVDEPPQDGLFGRQNIDSAHNNQLANHTDDVENNNNDDVSEHVGDSQRSLLDREKGLSSNNNNNNKDIRQKLSSAAKQEQDGRKMQDALGRSDCGMEIKELMIQNNILGPDGFIQDVEDSQIKEIKRELFFEYSELKTYHKSIKVVQLINSKLYVTVILLTGLTTFLAALSVPLYRWTYENYKEFYFYWETYEWMHQNVSPSFTASLIEVVLVICTWVLFLEICKPYALILCGVLQRLRESDYLIEKFPFRLFSTPQVCNDETADATVVEEFLEKREDMLVRVHYRWSRVRSSYQVLVFVHTILMITQFLRYALLSSNSYKLSTSSGSTISNSFASQIGVSNGNESYGSSSSLGHSMVQSEWEFLLSSVNLSLTILLAIAFICASLANGRNSMIWRKVHEQVTQLPMNCKRRFLLERILRIYNGGASVSSDKNSGNGGIEDPAFTLLGSKMNGFMAMAVCTIMILVVLIPMSPVQSMISSLQIIK